MALLEGAAGAVASQAAGEIGSDAILANLFNPATIQSTDAIMQNALAPSLAELGTEELGMDAILNAGLGNQAIGNIATNALQQGAGNIFGVVTTPAEKGFMGQLSDLFGNKGLTNAANIGFKGYQAYNSAKARKDAQSFQNQQLAMAQDAYKRNVEADEKRQSLNF